MILQTKILIHHNGKWLLLRKVRDIHPDHIGCWEVPGGKVELQEDIRTAALREVKEETGLQCRLEHELSPLKLTKGGLTAQTHVFVGTINSNKIVLSKEHDQYCWLTEGEIHQLDSVIYKSLLERYIQEAKTKLP